jgi:hypothetical protein
MIPPVSAAAKLSLCRGTNGRTLRHDSAIKRELIGFTHGVEFMNKLVEIRSQEFMCRERALLDSERKTFWLAQAEEWEQRALDEIAYHFRECNLAAEPSLPTSH